MAKLKYFNIIMICALSTSGIQAGDSWYSNWVRRMNRPVSEISGAEAMTAIGGAITSGYEKIQDMIEKMNPEYVRLVQEGKIVPNIYNPSRLMGGTAISDFEVLDRALKGTYGPALQKLAQQKALALAGQGLTQAAEAQIKSSWSNIGNFGKNQLKHRLGSIWSDYARPGIEYVGGASRYLVPTGLSQYAQTFPAVQRFTSLPRETQNLALGIAAPTAALAAYKLGRGAYQWWNKPTVEQLLTQIEELEMQDRLLNGQITRLQSGIDYFPETSSERIEREAQIAELVAKRTELNKTIENLSQQIAVQRNAQQQSWLNKARRYGSSWLPSSFW